MAGFRIPRYLDVETLVPLANYHDVEVMVDREVSDRVLRAGGGEAKIKARAGLVDAEAGGKRAVDSETKVTRTIRSAPAGALNELVDALLRNNELKTSVENVAKRDLVEIETDWMISPASDAASMLATIVGAISADPTILQADEPPPEVIAAMMSPDTATGALILQQDDEQASDGGTATATVIVLARQAHLYADSVADDLEGEHAVFGIVENFVPEGEHFDLGKMLLAGLPRAFRRQIDAAELLQGFAGEADAGVDPQALNVPGPVVLVRAIAIY